jgi:hypothetical protein
MYVSVFVPELLNKYQAEGLLDGQPEIPPDEIWLKIGENHSGGTFKAVLQVANLEKLNTFLILITNCRDSHDHDNLRKLFARYEQQVRQLQQMTWRGRQLRIFLFGDNDFLLKMYGLSGPQGIHPCLWCKASRDEIQQPHQLQQAPKRTLESLTGDVGRYRKAQRKKKKVTPKNFGNMNNSAILDSETDAVLVPPYLHLLLGIVQ